MDQAALHQRARRRGANGFVYWPVRVTFQLFFHLYFRMARIGREHIPRTGPVILAANHRSFLDPFIIGTLARRPMYYVAKQELFANPVVSWLLSALGAFPVARGQGDGEMIRTATDLLSRGEIVLIFPEGTRTRPGPLAKARRGVGRLALETGAPVIPVAVIGTESVRRGWRIRPHRVRVRVGPPLDYPQLDYPRLDRRQVDDAARELAGAVTERIWRCVMLQWEWLGGTPALDREQVVYEPAEVFARDHDHRDLETVGDPVSAG